MYFFSFSFFVVIFKNILLSFVKCVFRTNIFKNLILTFSLKTKISQSFIFIFLIFIIVYFNSMRIFFWNCSKTKPILFWSNNNWVISTKLIGSFKNVWKVAWFSLNHSLLFQVYIIQKLCQFFQKLYKSIKFYKLSDKHLDNKFNICFNCPNLGSSSILFYSLRSSANSDHKMSKNVKVLNRNKKNN